MAFDVGYIHQSSVIWTTLKNCITTTNDDDDDDDDDGDDHRLCVRCDVAI